MEMSRRRDPDREHLTRFYHENYDHLLKYNLPIRGETFVRIVHNLMVPPGINSLNCGCLFAHVALNQCRRFLKSIRALPEFLSTTRRAA